MAKATRSKIPLDSSTGRLGRTDRTLGRERGFAVNMSDATADGSTKLSTKRTVPLGGSAARHAQVGKYCKCDVRYKGLDKLRVDTFKKWYTTLLWVKSTKLAVYQLWIKVCLLAWPELSLFVDYCWYGRWEIFNEDQWDKEDVEIEISGLRYPPRSLGDCVAVLVPQEKHGGTTLQKVAFTANSLTIVIPSMKAGTICLVDLYWHYNPAKDAQG